MKLSKNLLFALSLIFTSVAFGQTEADLNDPENKIFYFTTGPRFEFFYGNGHTEKVKRESDKELQLAVIMNKIINSGWKLASVQSMYSMADGSSASYYFVREE
jgi:hypothetical protein